MDKEQNINPDASRVDPSEDMDDLVSEPVENAEQEQAEEESAEQ